MDPYKTPPATPPATPTPPRSPSGLSTFSNLTGFTAACNFFVDKNFPEDNHEPIRTGIDLEGLLSPQDPEHLEGCPPEDKENLLDIATLAQALAEERIQEPADGSVEIVVDASVLDSLQNEAPIQAPEPNDKGIDYGVIGEQNRSLAAGQEDPVQESDVPDFSRFQEAVEKYGELYYIKGCEGKIRFVVPSQFMRIPSQKPAVFPEASAFHEFTPKELISGYKNDKRTCMAFFTMTGKHPHWKASSSLRKFEEKPNNKCKGSSTGAGNGCNSENCKKVKTYIAKNKVAQLWLEYANAVFEARVPVQEYTEKVSSTEEDTA